MMHGYDSVVGPVKGVYDKDSGTNKAREHNLLISERPPFVTILTLGIGPVYLFCTLERS